MSNRLPAVVVAVLATAGFGASEARASCAAPTPMFHGLDSFFLCDKSGPTGAFAYQQRDAAGVNTAAVDILCIAPDGTRCFGSGSGSVSQVTIETDWSNPGIAGCPVNPSGPQRVVIVVGGGGGLLSGFALIVSLSGADPDFGYIIEAAHRFDPATGLAFPLSCGETVVQVSASGGRVLLHFRHPPIHTDCDPESIGALFLTACRDAFSPGMSFGPVYTRVQPCSERVELRREFWTTTGVVPAADGWATIIQDASPPGYCTFIGGTTVVNGVETGVVTGFVLSNVDCTDIDGDGYVTCGGGGGDCDDHNPAVHPGATEICNGIDDDCDRVIDEEFDLDGDGIADCFDNCPAIANAGQENRDGDPMGDVCDNCPDVANPDQVDTDFDSIGDLCDNCPTIPNVNQDPCVCSDCGLPNVTISFSSPLGKGSGLVTWTSVREVDIIGFNVVEFTNKGERIQLNPALIRCEECITGVGHTYTYIIPKHRSGRNIFIEMLRVNGTIQVFGPAQRV